MIPVPDDLPDELERQLVAVQQKRQRSDSISSSNHSLKATPEIEALANLAEQLQAALSLQVDPAFARRLERYLLAQNGALQRSRATRRGWNWSLFGFSRTRSTIVLARCLLMLVIVMGTGVLVVSAQVGDPNNPLYAVKLWEHQVQVSFVGSSADQVELHLKFARDQLTTLGNFTNASESSSYHQSLANFDRQVTTATQEIQALPAGTDQDRLTQELATLQTDARHTLHELLGKLAFPERLLTTDELGRLGDTIPSLTQAQVTLPAQPNGQASVSISGSDLQPGAHLLVDGQPVAASSAFENGVYLFTVGWQGNKHPHTIGILNPDGTAAQTTHVIVQTSNTGGGNGNGNGGGNGGGKPKGTPTPHGGKPQGNSTPHVL